MPVTRNNLNISNIEELSKPQYVSLAEYLTHPTKIMFEKNLENLITRVKKQYAKEFTYYCF